MKGFLKIANFRITKHGSWQDLVIPSENQDKADDQTASEAYPFDLEAILNEDRFTPIASKRDKFLFMTAIAVTADKANDNGDYFPEDELVEAYPTFVRRGIYMNHDNDKAEKAIGVILGSYWDESDKNVKILAAVSRDKAAKTCTKIETGIITDVSMGCFCKSSECSKCQHIATSDEELCECTSQLRASKYDGSVYEINRGLVFIECSIIDELSEGADPGAKIMDKMAKLVKQADLHKLGQEVPAAPVAAPLVEMKFLEDGRMLIKILKAKELTVDKLVTILIDSGFAPSGFTKDDLFTPSKGVIVSMGDAEAEIILPPKSESDADSVVPPDTELEPEIVEEAPPEDLGTDMEVEPASKRTAMPVPPQTNPSPTGDVPEGDKYEKALDYINTETKKGRGYDEVEMEAKQKFQLGTKKSQRKDDEFYNITWVAILHGAENIDMGVWNKAQTRIDMIATQSFNAFQLTDKVGFEGDDFGKYRVYGFDDKSSANKFKSNVEDKFESITVDLKPIKRYEEDYGDFNVRDFLHQKRKAQKGVQPVSPEQGGGGQSANPQGQPPGGAVDMSQPESSDVQMEMPQDQFAPNSKVLLTGTTGTVQEVTPEGKLMITIDGLDSNVLVEPDQVSPYSEEEMGTGDVDYEADDVLGGEPPSVVKNEMKKLEKRFGLKVGTKVKMPNGSENVGVVRAVYEDGTAQITPLTAQDLQDDMEAIDDALEEVVDVVEESSIEEYADIIEYLLESYLDGIEFGEAVEMATEYGLDIPPPEKLEEIINSIFDNEDDEGSDEDTEMDMDMDESYDNDNEGIEMEGGEKEAMRNNKKAQRRGRPVMPVKPVEPVAEGITTTPEVDATPVEGSEMTPKERMAKRLKALVQKKAEEKTKAKGGQGETYEYPKNMNAPGTKAPKNPLDEYSTKGHEETVPDIKSGFEYSKNTGAADVSPQVVKAKRLERQVARLRKQLDAEKAKTAEANKKLAAIGVKSDKAAKEVKAKRVVAIVNELDARNQFDTVAAKSERAAQLMGLDDSALDEVESILADEDTNVVPEETLRTATRLPRLASKRGGDSFETDLKDACMSGI